MIDEAGIEGTPLLDLFARIARRTPGDLVARAGGLDRLSCADAFEIAALVEGRDPDAPPTGPEGGRARRPTTTALRTARAIEAAFELGRRAERARARLPETVSSASDVAKWAAPRLGSLVHEELWILALDGRGHVRAARCIAKGGLHGAQVGAVDPLRAAIRSDASAFVLVHNHPSGDPTPSKEDVLLTERVARSAEIVGLVLLDHVVVARGGFASVPIGSLPPQVSSTQAHAARTDGP